MLVCWVRQHPAAIYNIAVMKQLDGKTALITGGTSGIGLATARIFIDAGARVIINGRTQASVDAALAMGRLIRAQGLTTSVPAGAECASACALIWMAGQKRLLGRGARIGFHAISATRPDGSRVQTHAYDHVLRRYLTELGFAADMTATMVNTRAAAMRWFDPVELRANGVSAEVAP